MHYVTDTQELKITIFADITRNICMANSMKQTTEDNYILQPVRSANMKVQYNATGPDSQGTNCKQRVFSSFVFFSSFVDFFPSFVDFFPSFVDFFPSFVDFFPSFVDFISSNVFFIRMNCRDMIYMVD